VTQANLGKLTVFLLVLAGLLLAPIGRTTEAAELPAPRMYVVTPASDAPVNSPVQVALRFEAPNGSDIDLRSFQVLYQFGIFEKDITKQVLQYVTLTPTGLTGSTPPELPPGVHTLVIRIRDTEHRLAELKLRLNISS
jgi:hypothetical protein